MIADTSALLAILLGEAEADDFTRAIAKAATARLSAVSYVEAGIRVDRLENPVARNLFDDLIVRLGLIVEPVTADQAYIARATRRDFGKGRHAGGLNLGDCFSYVLAEAQGGPLLYKGEDFSKTDVRSAA